MDTASILEILNTALPAVALVAGTIVAARTVGIFVEHYQRRRHLEEIRQQRQREETQRLDDAALLAAMEADRLREEREAMDRRLALLDGEIPGSSISQPIRPILREPEDHWVRHYTEKVETENTGETFLMWRCPICATGNQAARTKAGGWSYSPRTCGKCEVVLQQARPNRQRTTDGVQERLYHVREPPTQPGLDRIQMLLDT